MISSKHFEWIEVKDYQEMSELAASRFERQLNAKPDSILGLSTGGSPVGFYKELVARHRLGKASFANASTFNLDEYVGIDEMHPTSYHRYMDRHLFYHVDLPAAQRHLPSGTEEDLLAECARYESEIAASGGIDLQLLGIGVNGHIGFNEPGTSFDSTTHVVKLAEATRVENAKYFPSLDEVPSHAITMGIHTIMQAREIVLLAFGEHKMEAINRLKTGGITEDFPASILKEHPHVTVFYGK